MAQVHELSPDDPGPAVGRLDCGEDVPPLRNADILQWTGSVFVLPGVEEVADDKLYAQTWQMTPEALVELEQAERNIGRHVNHLRVVGVSVQMLPGGDMRTPDERRADGEPF